MRAAIVFAALALLCGSAAADGAGLAEGATAIGREPDFSRAVIDSFASPGIAPMGIDWVEADGVLYHVDEEFGDVYSITPEGVATWLFDVPTQTGVQGAGANGVCYVSVPGRDDEYLYITDYNGAALPPTDMVYQFTLDGTLVSSWDIESVCDSVIGICFDETHFWLSSYSRRQIIKCDAAFNEIAAYSHPGATAGGLDYDPATGLYYLTEFIWGIVYVCDSEMTVQSVFVAHPTALNMVGVTVGRTVRGRALWCSKYWTDEQQWHSIYEIDDDYYNPVEETSWGFIKAMFR